MRISVLLAWILIGMYGAMNASAAVDTKLLIKSVPQIKPVKLGKLSPAFDWINKERVRAMFGYLGEWNNTDLIDHVVDAGFNMMPVHMMSYGMSEEGFPKEVAQWASIQKHRKLRIFICWPFGSDERYGNTEFGAYNTGTSEIWTHTPCPLSTDYWNRVIGDRAVIAAKAGLSGMVVDMEMYGADRTRYLGSCYCDNCWGRFVDQYIGTDSLKKLDPTKRAAWVSDNGIWEDYDRWQEIEVASILKVIEKNVHSVNPNFILGNLLDPESIPGIARGFGTPTMPALIFSELEYQGNVTGVPARAQQLKDLGYPALYVPGFWIQPVTPPQLPELVCEAAPKSAGYWIWGSSAFNPKLGGDYAHAKGFSDDDYWNAFRLSNSRLSEVLKSGAKTSAFKSTVPHAKVPRVNGAPKTASDWSKAVAIGPFVDYNSGKPAKVETMASALWDGTRVYLKIICEEPLPEKMTAPSGDRDYGGLWMQDSIEVFWTRPNGNRMAHIIVNNAGTIADSLKVGMGSEAPGWNPDIKTTATKTVKGWELILSLPIEQDGAEKIASGSQLRMEIVRNRPGGNETTCWAPTKGMFNASIHLWGTITLK